MSWFLNLILSLAKIRFGPPESSSSLTIQKYGQYPAKLKEHCTQQGTVQAATSDN